jgi:rubredoxin
MKNLGNFKCPQCGWVHSGISEADAIAAVADVNKHYEALSAAARAASFIRGPASLDMYQRCFKCGAPAKSFVSAAPGDAPLLTALQTVIAPITSPTHQIDVEPLGTANETSTQEEKSIDV